MRGAADAAREAGHVTIASYQMDSYLSRYDVTVGEGLDVNPQPASRKRDSHTVLQVYFVNLVERSHSLPQIFGCHLITIKQNVTLKWRRSGRRSRDR